MFRTRYLVEATADALKEHLRDCHEDREKTRQAFDDFSKALTEGLAKQETARQHSFERVESTLWKIALGVIGALGATLAGIVLRALHLLS